MSNRDKFWDTYAVKLAEAVRTTPEDYPNNIEADTYGKIVADKFRSKPFTDINHEGRGFRLTCKELGIKHTRKAIKAYLES